jgi:hypothetical protein
MLERSIFEVEARIYLPELIWRIPCIILPILRAL